MQSLLNETGEAAALGASGLAAHEVTAFRTAGIFLLALGGLGIVFAFVSGTTAVPSIGSLIDCFLGYQLLRLHDSWRAWVLVRAAVGLLFGLFLIFVGLSGRPHAIVVGVAQLLACTALAILLWGSPSPRRVFVGQGLCVASALFFPLFFIV